MGEIRQLQKRHPRARSNSWPVSHTRNSSVVGLAIAGVGMKLGLWRRLRKSAINFVIQQIF
jgi:hypothetical protein